MNFATSRRGFYEDESRGNLPFSQSSSTSSSSSSSSQQKGLVSLSYPQHLQLQRRGGWNETAFRCYSGGGGSSHLDLTMDSSSPTNINISGDDADESDENLLLRLRGGDSSEGLGSGSAMVIEREHMFDKVVTPSDVGKLNRLVIPKQHAEKYFPLDSSTNEKGLLLNFEDRNGKPWRFRYSYWNSSQSYVMTKGWSRFVKEKKLDAGDIVSFERGVGELAKDRLFIDWRRRPDAPDHHHLPPPIPAFSLPHHFAFHHWNHPYYLQQEATRAPPRDPSQFFQVNPINSHQSHLNSYGYSSLMSGGPCPSGSVVYLRSAPGGIAAAATSPQVQTRGRDGGIQEPMVFESVPVVQGKAAAKRLRLFGVNMECPISESDDEFDILSSTAVPHSTMAPQPSQSQSYLSSSSSIPTPQLRPYGLQTLPPDLLNKGKASMSLDFDV